MVDFLQYIFLDVAIIHPLIPNWMHSQFLTILSVRKALSTLIVTTGRITYELTNGCKTSLKKKKKKKKILYGLFSKLPNLFVWKLFLIKKGSRMHFSSLYPRQYIQSVEKSFGQN
jgi:hypothetical protein